ncbi:PAS domain S-box protein [Candidatus Uhrbacteria bacterium]|nr:PAS domain S-box protein [Candidatus Uhrbacteria bacterium]
MKVLTKVTLIISTGAFFMLATAGYFVFTETKNALQQTIRDRQSELGHQTIDKIDRTLFGYYVGIQNIADEESIQRTLSGAVQDRREIERRIKELPFLTGPWDVLKIINSQGAIIASNSRQDAEKNAEIEKNIENLAALKEAIKGNVYYSDFLFTKDTGRPTMIFAAPIRDQETADQPIIGVVIGHVAWPVIKEIIEASDPASEFDLYTRGGVLIATNQESAKHLFLKNTEIERSLSAPPHVANLIKTEADEGFEALVTRADSHGHLAYKGNQWALFIETPTSIAFAPAISTARRIVLVLLPIILFILFVILLLLSSLVVRPIVDITKVSKVIAVGDFSARVRVRTKDEIGELAISFNAMTEKMRESLNIINIERDKLAKLIESMGDSVMVIDTEGKITLWNYAAALLTGWEQKEVIGRPFKDILKLVREADRASNSDFIVRAITEKVKKSMENHTLLIRKDGTEIPVADSAAPIIDADGDVWGAIVVFRDVAKERELERLKTDFVAIASHEMRTPLTLIKGNSERLLKGESILKDAKLTEMVSSIYRNSDRLFGIVNDFLDVLTLEEKRIPLNLEHFDLVPLVHECVAEFRTFAEAKKIYLKIDDLSASHQMVVADRARVRQVMINLLGNAMRHTEKGGVRLTFEKQKNFIEVSVNDTGPGISKENQLRLFRKFGSIRETFIRSKEYGSGLGLYISKLLIEAMGGEIWLKKSSPGAGSTFSFTLRTSTDKEGV